MDIRVYALASLEGLLSMGSMPSQARKMLLDRATKEAGKGADQVEKPRRPRVTKSSFVGRART